MYLYTSSIRLSFQACFTNIQRICWILVVILLGIPMVKAQKIEMPLHNRVIVNYPEKVVYAYYLPSDQKHKPAKESLFYYWFAANDIKRTRGAYDGKLLHGTYTEFYSNKNLKEKGVMRHGIKTGIWQGWYGNGERKEIIHWDKKGLRGRFRTFNESGNLTSRGTYWNDKLDGKVYVYDEAGKKTKLRYKDGNLLTKVKKNRKQKKADAPQVESQQGKETKWRKLKRKMHLPKIHLRKSKKTATDGQPASQNPAPADQKKKKERKGKKEKAEQVSNDIQISNGMQVPNGVVETPSVSQQENASSKQKKEKKKKKQRKAPAEPATNTTP
ncbi:hypothetical protein QNI16_36815 [Cytophagaceae bacterium YF14B1]|uniref:Toxin-antitoxin system YwqK family antitoxin n=1 Tax=Xanthocytophaga flava TaxID=3048013 RepID=A0AAE3QZ51_9BACT|nr:hypothetical protein [Xanthocytophaga flavus]MDJ1486103.1 hypothetical protein [Xanthocytophaga flavus]